MNSSGADFSSWQEKKTTTYPRVKIRQNDNNVCACWVSDIMYLLPSLLLLFFAYLHFVISPPLSAGTYSVVHVRNSEIKQLWPLLFAMLWDIDLIFGMWVYNDKLQIEFTFRYGSMIFGWVMALGLWNLAKYLAVTTFVVMLVDIDLIFGIWVYNDELQMIFEIHSGWMIFGQLTAVWALKFCQIFNCHNFFHYDLRYWFDFWNVDLRRLEDTDAITEGISTRWNICEPPYYSRWGHSSCSDTSSFSFFRQGKQLVQK